jgi:hypothetical protein
MSELRRYKDLVEKTRNHLEQNWIDGDFRSDEYVDDFNEDHEGRYSISVEEEIVNDDGILESWEVSITEEGTDFKTYIRKEF